MNFDLNKLFDMQDKLNVFTAGEVWKDGYNHKNMRLNYARYASYEMVELANSYNFKTWKDLKNLDDFNKPNDIENIKVELVDTLHFIISLCQMNRYKQNNMFIEDEFMKAFNNENTEFKIFDDLDLVDSIISMLSSISRTSGTTFIKKEFDNPKFKEKYNEFITCEISFIQVIIQQFLELSSRFMSKNDLFKLYTLKCGLNYLRQKNGYAEGKYIKNWNINLLVSKDNLVKIDEDNQLLGYLFNTNKDVEDSDINKLLKEEYGNEYNDWDEFTYINKYLETTYKNLDKFKV